LTRRHPPAPLLGQATTHKETDVLTPVL